MRDPFSAPLGTTVKFNPHLWGDEELRGIFVARRRELDEILARLRATAPERVPQHLLITGYRGMGKTTLLRRIALAVQDDPELSGPWIALTFPEEQYTVSTLAELWSNVLDALADTLERQGAAPAELERLDGRIQALQALAPSDREAAALELLQDWVARQGRRILLLIDSTDLLFSGLAKGEPGSGKGSGDATPLWRLRKTLSHFPGILWLGASYQALESAHPYSDAFHDFFELIELRPLSVAEMRDALLALARTFGAGPELRGEAAVEQMRRSLQARPERLQALRTLTGGNPRTTVVLYELFAAGWDGDLHTDLKALLDLMTPLYKARMEQLAEQPRKLLAHLMEHWAPIATRDLAAVSGLPTSSVSGQLTRLEAEGLVEKARLAGTRRSGYQASERFFNIWYLMRYSPRRVRQRLTWLVEFMRLWFSTDDLRGLAQRHGTSLRSSEGHSAERLQYALALADALPVDCREHHQLEWSVFSAARRTAEQVRRPLAEILPDLFDPSGADRAFVTADDYLRRFEALDAKLARCPHLRDAEERRSWIEAAKGSLALVLVEKERLAEDAAGLTEDQFNSVSTEFAAERENWFNVNEETYRAVRQDTLTGAFFPDCPDAELAYRQMVGQFGDRAETLHFALALMEQNHHNEWTERVYRKLLEIAPNRAEAWNGLGNLLQDYLGRYDEAETSYRRAIALDPKFASLWNNLGNLLQAHLGRYTEAEAAYRRAIELNPKYSYPWYNLGNLLQYQLGHYDEAEAAYRRAIELDPKFAYPWYGLGNLLQDPLGRFDEAEAAYRRAIELDPKFAYPWYGLGNLLQDHLGRFDEAEAAYRRAIEIDSKDAYPVANLARLAAQRGHRRKADTLYRQVASLAMETEHAPPGGDYAELLLQAHLWLGNRDAAAQALARLATPAYQGDALALSRLQEQARECHAIGLGSALAELMEASELADFLRPIALALHAAGGRAEALEGLAPELRTMAEAVLEDLLDRLPGRRSQGMS